MSKPYIEFQGTESEARLVAACDDIHEDASGVWTAYVDLDDCTAVADSLEDAGRADLADTIRSLAVDMVHRISGCNGDRSEG